MYAPLFAFEFVICEIRSIQAKSAAKKNRTKNTELKSRSGKTEWKNRMGTIGGNDIREIP